LTLRIAQIGTGHGHAAGKWLALRGNPDVEAVGVWEADPLRRHADRFAGARWFASVAEVLADPTIVAVAIETRNHQSLSIATQVVQAGKHLWFDKPAGDDWPTFAQLMQHAAERSLHVQLGYMFRYSPGFEKIWELVHSGQLGHVFEVRAHMSTSIDIVERTEQSRHRGGILYDLGGHMIDQLVWLLGRPTRVSAAFGNHATPERPDYSDNSACVLEFPGALGIIDIAAMESRPTARRFEVYGILGSAMLEPFDASSQLRWVHDKSVEIVELPPLQRQELYERELVAFVAVLRGERKPDRTPEHELLVQETLLRATGRLG